ncbi:hypothetical protein Bpfe_012267 [Biomphalaria pfeifferi]|uniref:Uncharacterized protein n=1 Tax=Biomphalaria pfeifferi TaxID=112525 RepID=A0AAD8FCE1_BIOPF|nr:hypothetical protein Bpfe_012267 [Biomphalaria pfeifferi]
MASPSIWKVLNKSFVKEKKCRLSKPKDWTEVKFVSVDNKKPVISLCDCKRYRTCHQSNGCRKAIVAIQSNNKSLKALEILKSKKKLGAKEKYVTLLSSDLSEFYSLRRKKIKERIKKRRRSHDIESLHTPSNISLHNASSCSTSSFLTQVNNLKRNSLLRPYSFVYLPFTSMESFTKPKDCYREELFEFFEKESFNWASNFLMDFSAKYEIRTTTLMHLINLFIENICTLTATQKTVLNRSFNFICQKNCSIIPTLPIDIVLKEKSEVHLNMCLKFLELNLFARNMCDNSQILHSYAYLQLSWDKGRSNLLHILQLLGNLVRETESHPNVTKLFAVQGLVALGLMTSLRDQMNAFKCVSVEVYKLYASLQRRDQKILLLQTCEFPLLVILVTRKAIEEQFNVTTTSDDCPSLQDVVNFYFTPDIKLSLTHFDKDGCEEYVVLLYFLLWGTIENVKRKANLSYRSRLMQQELGGNDPIVEESSVVREFSKYMKSICQDLSEKTRTYLSLIDLLLEGFVVRRIGENSKQLNVS